MADAASIAAVGRSLVRFLDRGFDAAEPVVGKSTSAALVRTSELEEYGTGGPTIPALTLFLVRVDFNRTMRAAWSARGAANGEAHLPLDLHYIATPWADNALDEHRILGRAMQIFEDTPILSGPLLHASGGWSPEDSVQVVLEEVSTEAVMRTFDSLPLDYHLSVPYLVRVVRVDGLDSRAHPRASTVVAGLTPSVEVEP